MQSQAALTNGDRYPEGLDSPEVTDFSLSQQALQSVGDVLLHVAVAAKGRLQQREAQGKSGVDPSPHTAGPGNKMAGVS